MTRKTTCIRVYKRLASGEKKSRKKISHIICSFVYLDIHTSTNTRCMPNEEATHNWDEKCIRASVGCDQFGCLRIYHSTLSSSFNLLESNTHLHTTEEYKRQSTTSTTMLKTTTTRMLLWIIAKIFEWNKNKIAARKRFPNAITSRELLRFESKWLKIAEIHAIEIEYVIIFIAIEPADSFNGYSHIFQLPNWQTVNVIFFLSLSLAHCEYILFAPFHTLSITVFSLCMD